MNIKEINGKHPQFVRSTKRFANCKTYADMKSLLTPGETIGVYVYGGGNQVEVRTVRFGRRVIVATAEVVEPNDSVDLP